MNDPKRGGGHGHMTYFWSNGTDTRVPRTYFVLLIIEFSSHYNNKIVNVGQWYAAAAAIVICPYGKMKIFTDTILISLVPTSLVHRNWYCLSPSSITNPRTINPRTLFLVFHNLFPLVFVLLTLSSVSPNAVMSEDMTYTKGSDIIYKYLPHIIFVTAFVVGSVICVN